MKTLEIYSSFLLAAIAGIFLASSAQAEDWFFMVESDTDIKFFLDRDSITRTGKVSGVNTFEVNQEPEEDGTIAILVRREYSCQEKRSRVKQVISLLENQSMGVYKESTAWASVKANSIDDLILQKVCKAQ
ncbi:surface-adhesin E family protein [Leptolyngbyaceae cyanobacterium UHCC 1019]